MAFSEELDNIIRQTNNDCLKEALTGLKNDAQSENIESGTRCEIWVTTILKQMVENHNYDKLALREIINLYIEAFGESDVLDMIQHFIPLAQLMECLLEIAKYNDIPYCDYMVD